MAQTDSIGARLYMVQGWANGQSPLRAELFEGLRDRVVIGLIMALARTKGQVGDLPLRPFSSYPKRICRDTTNDAIQKPKVTDRPFS